MRPCPSGRHRLRPMRLGEPPPSLRGEGLTAEQVRSRLRDAGLTAVSACASNFTASFDNLGREFCISVRGKVRSRLPGKHNPNLPTGDVELEVAELQCQFAAHHPHHRRGPRLLGFLASDFERLRLPARRPEGFDPLDGIG